MKKRPWLSFALITTVFWGVWGALMEVPIREGFPATLGYIVWSLTMIPNAVVGLWIIGWKLEYNWKSIVQGSLIGFLGAGGQISLAAGGLRPNGSLQDTAASQGNAGFIVRF